MYYWCEDCEFTARSAADADDHMSETKDWVSGEWTGHLMLWRVEDWVEVEWRAGTELRGWS